ncbi:MAG TPA: IS1634 family transposase [Gammaproteobacteria bacterium]|nr:IS1634 family transposase [Gammaproteobacteria bacterium]
MNEKPTIITERVDDIPLLLAQMDRMGLAEVLDAHFPTHGNWQGLSFGRVTTIWLSSILSRGDHRLVHVEPWVAQRQMILSHATGEVVRAQEFSDDRLEIVLRLFSDDHGWVSFESALNQHLVRVYDLQAERVHVDSTSASAYARVSDDGLFQFGHSKDHRPDLPQVKVMQAVLDPLGMPLATDVVSGERADDPLYIPCIERVQASLGRSGLLYVGDCKMASRPTRAWIAAQGAYYLCPLPQVQLSEGELEAAVESALRGDVKLGTVYREVDDGKAERIAQGYERQVPMALDVAGESHSWLERRLVVQSLRHAKAAEEALRARVAKARAQVEALNQRGRGRKRFEEITDLRHAVNAIVQRHQVEDFLWLRYEQQCTAHPVRAYRDRAAGSKVDRHATVEVRVDEEALAAAVRRFGWRMYATNQPKEQLSLEQAVLAYRSEYLVERSLGRLKGRPLSLTPMYVQRDDYATGLIRLLSIALRVLTLMEFVGRRHLALEQDKIAGLYAGNPKRETMRPTAERLLEAFEDVTLTVIELPSQTLCHITPLSPVQRRVLEILGFSSEVYTRLEAVSVEPP